MTWTLQTNVNHSRPAQDLALVTAENLNAKLIIISEPYLFNGNLPSIPGWSQFSVRNVALLVRDGVCATQTELHSDDLVMITIEDTTFIGVYLLPNNDISAALALLAAATENLHWAVIGATLTAGMKGSHRSSCAIGISNLPAS